MRERDAATPHDVAGLETRDLLVFWAKTPQDHGDPHEDDRPPWHPLLCHLLDVAAVAETLWDRVLGSGVRAWVARELGLDASAARQWTTFLAGTHDVGKASPAFAFQDERAARRLEREGYRRPAIKPACPHGTISALTLRDVLPAEYGLSREMARTLADVVGGHHGVFPDREELAEVSQAATGSKRWSAAREELLRRVLALVGPSEGVPQRAGTPVSMWLAGLISVADWIGSDQQYFPLEAEDPETVPDLDPERYLDDKARPRAAIALQALGWLARPGRGSSASFKELFEFEPNVMQVGVAQAGEAGGSTSLVIVEAPMGEGKTEAALWLAHRRAHALQAPGLYFALPTQATSNAMLGRLRNYLARAHPDTDVNLQLLHGMASLSGELLELRRNAYRIFQPDSIDRDTGDRAGWSGPPSILATEWFTHRKRGLLAPFGVGTVDQALLSVLKSRHVFVRLFGLGGKTVIVDEVHAYDAYMSTLLERLLEWLASLGVFVVLLSATLPAGRRTALLQAYARGRGEGLPEVEDAPYPRVSWAGHHSGARTLQTSASSRRRVHLRWIPDLLEMDASGRLALAGLLEEALRHGGCAAVICNTVNRAQQVYAALAHVSTGRAGGRTPAVDLFHARFPFEQRSRREKRVLRRFGKGTQRRPRRAILVATQVIEQSLDVDFDVMVTDFAPVDLLLQRSGRLWRHERVRPDTFVRPELFVSSPRVSDSVPSFDDGTRAVYDAHVLLRSWLALNGRHTIDVPEDVSSLIEDVYADQAPPAHLDTNLRAQWEETLGKLMAARNHDEEEAVNRAIKPPCAGDPLARIVNEVLDEDAPALHPQFQALTRLAPPSVTVVCLYGTEESPSLDREGVRRIDLGSVPPVREAAALLRRSVNISHRGVVHSVLAHGNPASWRKSPLLRHCYPLFLDSSGVAQLPNTRMTIRLDPELGIVIDREDKEA